jgi:hypothetical protein
MARELRTVSNKQVELFDRLRQVEERLDMLLERVRRIEDTIRHRLANRGELIPIGQAGIRDVQARIYVGSRRGCRRAEMAPPKGSNPLCKGLLPFHSAGTDGVSNTPVPSLRHRESNT